MYPTASLWKSLGALSYTLTRTLKASTVRNFCGDNGERTLLTPRKAQTTTCYMRCLKMCRKRCSKRSRVRAVAARADFFLPGVFLSSLSTIISGLSPVAVRQWSSSAAGLLSILPKRGKCSTDEPSGRRTGDCKGDSLYGGEVMVKRSEPREPG
eukprot:1178988-Prorocentrum_minimum.AAC.2